MKKRYSKFYKLKNNQWMKIVFSHNKENNIWFQSIIVSNSKRKCNDSLYKTKSSPKNLFGKVTGNSQGLEVMRIALRELLEFEKSLRNTQINILGASDRLSNIYKYLKRYGYVEHNYEKNGKAETLLYKIIN